MGITPHGLRHQFGTDLFKDLCGLPAPVLQAASPEDYERNAEKVQAAFLEVSRQMGHERPSITGAYVSSVPKMARMERARLERWLELMAGCESDFQAAGAQEAWLVGKCASGMLLPDGSAIQIAVRVDEHDPTALSRLRALGQALSASAPRSAWHVSAWTDLSRPDDGAEILIGRSSSAFHAASQTRGAPRAGETHMLQPELYLKVRAWMLANDPDAAEILQWSQQDLRPPKNPEDLAHEVIWIILCAGRSAQAARTIEAKVRKALDAGTPVVEAFGYRAKAAAIERAWAERAQDFAAMQAVLATSDARRRSSSGAAAFPFVGDDTKYQLAKNFGVQAVETGYPRVPSCRNARTNRAFPSGSDSRAVRRCVCIWHRRRATRWPRWTA
jgi:hypothetical protein